MPRINNNGNITVYNSVEEHDIAVNALSPTPILPPASIRFEGQTVGAETIDVSSFEIPQNIIGETEIKVKIIDVASGNFGIGWFVVTWRRFTNGPAIITTTPIIALQALGTLNGSSVSQAVVGNSIVGRFTGVVGRTINIYVDYIPSFVKF